MFTVDCYALAKQIVDYNHRYELLDMNSMVSEEESILSVEVDLSSSAETDSLFSRFNSVCNNPDIPWAQRNDADAILAQLTKVVVVQLTA